MNEDRPLHVSPGSHGSRLAVAMGEVAAVLILVVVVVVIRVETTEMIAVPVVIPMRNDIWEAIVILSRYFVCRSSFSSLPDLKQGPSCIRDRSESTYVQIDHSQGSPPC